MKRSIRLILVASGALLACNAIVGLDSDFDIAQPGTDGGNLPTSEASAGDTGTSSETSTPTEAGVDGGRACPKTGIRGAELVDVGDFCIDATEVTQSQYQAFIAERSTVVNRMPAECSYWDSGAVGPSCNFTPNPDGGTPNVPVTCVDWCDAYAYCRWAGKRLCGNRAGGAVPYSNLSRDPAVDQWYFACSAGGKQFYPYEGPLNPDACNLQKLNDAGQAIPGRAFDAGAALGCEGGFKGVFDMVGNVHEWQDGCEDGGAKAHCMNRGGHFNRHPTNQLSNCETAGNNETRDSKFGDIGFRCCWDGL